MIEKLFLPFEWFGMNGGKKTKLAFDYFFEACTYFVRIFDRHFCREFDVATHFGMLPVIVNVDVVQV